MIRRLADKMNMKYTIKNIGDILNKDCKFDVHVVKVMAENISEKFGELTAIGLCSLMLINDYSSILISKDRSLELKDDIEKLWLEYVMITVRNEKEKFNKDKFMCSFIKSTATLRGRYGKLMFYTALMVIMLALRKILKHLEDEEK